MLVKESVAQCARPNAHLKAGQALYPARWRLIGQRLHTRTAGDVVQIFAGNDVVATHLRLVRRCQARSASSCAGSLMGVADVVALRFNGFDYSRRRHLAACNLSVIC